MESAAREILVFFNPTAGAGTRIALVDGLCEAIGRDGFVIRRVDSPESLDECIVRLGAERRLRAVVAAGGDGTIRLVADHVPPEIPLAVFPLGTENLLAKYLWMTRDADQLAAALRAGHTVRLDAGRANGRLFLVMVSCGFDAEVVRLMHAQRRGHIRHWSYAKPIFDAIRSYRYPELRASCSCVAGGDGADVLVSGIHWAFVFNVPSYAAGLPIAPEATPLDGRLDVVTFPGGSLWKSVCHLAAVVMGRHRSLQGVDLRRVSRVRIESSVPVPFQMDGDPGGYLPIEIEVLPRRLVVVVPSGWRPVRTGPAERVEPIRGVASAPAAHAVSAVPASGEGS